MTSLPTLWRARAKPDEKDNLNCHQIDRSVIRIPRMRKKEIQEHILLLFKALGDENRLRILYELKGNRELSVGELVEKLEISQPLVSHHLRELKTAGLVVSRKKGPYVFYRLRDSRVFDLIALAQSILEGKK